MKKDAADAVNLSMYKCWNCEADLQDLIICENCKTVQPLSPTNVFKDLGLRPEFDIDLNLLSECYLERQRLIHPDKFISKTAEEKLYAQQHSSHINQCYQILNDNISRAEAVIKYNNQSPDTGDNTIQDPVLLHESMEHREKLMMMESKNQVTDFKKEILDLNHIIEKNIKVALDIDKDFNQAKRLVLRLKYLKKLLLEINQKELEFS